MEELFPNVNTFSFSESAVSDSRTQGVDPRATDRGESLSPLTHGESVSLQSEVEGVEARVVRGLATPTRPP